MKKIFIVGFGRFGQVFGNFLGDNHEVMAYDPEDFSSQAASLGVKWVGLEEGINSADTIIYAVPISAFKEIFLSHLPILKAKNEKTLVMDVQSVKVTPKQIYDEYLPENCDLLLTHPMFGPDSVKEHGVEGLRIMMDHHRCPDTLYDFWKDYFISKKLHVSELTSEEHDLMAARSQGLAFFLARVLEDFKFQPTEIDTLWVEKLHEITDALTNDSWQLFSDLQSYNPYTKDMRVALGESLHKIFNKLLPERIKEDRMVIGIQGGKGSFNEEAIRKYAQETNSENFELMYLHTAENVLNALYHGDIDLGQFAVHNSAGGMKDSIKAAARYRFEVLHEHSIEVCHVMMCHPEANAEDVTTVMTHPQIFVQCKNHLQRQYPHLEQRIGEGELINPEKVAEELANSQLPKSTAVIGSRSLAEIHGLNIMAENLQDLEKNLTSFLIVQR